MQISILNAAFREGVYAEIEYKNVIWAEVSYDSDASRFMIKIFEPPHGEDDYVFPLAEVQAALERAQHRLMEYGYGT